MYKRALGGYEMIETEKLLNVDRIYEVWLNRNADHKKCIVKLRYIDKKQLMTEIDIPLLDAQYLLNLLKRMNIE